MTAEQVFICHGRPRLLIDVTQGTFFIRGWDGDTVRIEGYDGEIRQRGDKFYLDSSLPCSCNVYLPRRSEVYIDGINVEINMAGIQGKGRIDCTNGSISIEDWQGDLNIDCTGANARLSQCKGDIRFDSGSGNLDISSSQGNVVCDTSSGSITIQDCSGSISADTGSGNVQVANFRGPVHIDTSEGDAMLQSVFSRNVYVDSGGGSITAVLPGAVPGRWQLTAGSGNIDLQVPENISSRFEFEGSELDVDDLNLDILVREDDGIKGRINQGEGIVRAASSSGTISARRVSAAATAESQWQVQDEEALQILRLLEKGTITTDEADRLLAALNGSGEAPSELED